jgi:hypothetical protein
MSFGFAVGLSGLRLIKVYPDLTHFCPCCGSAHEGYGEIEKRKSFQIDTLVKL